MKITKAKYNWLVAQYNYRKNKEQLIEISDEEYQRLTGKIVPQGPTGNTEPETPTGNTEPIEPVNQNKQEYLYIEALEDGQMIFNTNNYTNITNPYMLVFIYFKINYGSFKTHRYNSSLTEEYNIYTYDIHKGDKIYFYRPTEEGGRYPEFTFNFAIKGNILTYNKSYHNYYLNENQLNLNNVEFYLPNLDKCLFYDIYVPECVILIIGDKYYTNGYNKSHDAVNYIYFKNEDLLLKKITSSQLAHYYNNISYWSLSEYYIDNIYYTKKDNNCYLLIDKEDFSTNDLYMDMIKSNIGRDYVKTENDIDYYTKYLYKLDFLINIRQTSAVGRSVIIGKTEYNNIYLLKNKNSNWNIEPFESDSYIINNQQFYEINENYKIIHTLNNNDDRIHIIEYDPETFELTN